MLHAFALALKRLFSIATAKKSSGTQSAELGDLKHVPRNYHHKSNTNHAIIKVQYRKYRAKI